MVLSPEAMPGRQQQSNVPISKHQPHGMNFGHQLNGTIPHNEPNGTLPTIEHSPNGMNSQYEEEEANLQHQQSQSVSQSRTPMSLQPAAQVEDDYLLRGIRGPVAANIDPHYFYPSIRDCPVLGCRCRIPDPKIFFGEHELWEIDGQVFRALWEAPEMEGLNSTYLPFSLIVPVDEYRPYLQRNNHFSARLQGDVFILKVQKSIDQRAVFVDPLGFPMVTLPRQYRVHGAQYQHIDPSFLAWDLFTEMTLAATSADSRFHNPSSNQFATPVGFWRAFVQEKLRMSDYQVPPVILAMGLIMTHFWPLHRGSPPPCIDPGLRSRVQQILPLQVSKGT